jgi:AraC-like DNA-binding protein
MQPTVSPATMRALATYARERRLAVDIAVRETRAPFDEVVDVWQRLAAAARDPLLGTHVAARAPFGVFGIGEHAMLVSATLERALQRLVRFYPLVNEAFALTLRDVRGGSLLEVHANDGTRILPVYSDYVIASIRRRIELALGGRYESRNGLFIDRDLARRPLPGADEELCEALESLGERRMAMSHRTTTDLVRDAVDAHLRGGDAALSSIARHLGTSERTLQRRLVVAGTSFRAVVDDARRTLALQLVAQRTPSRAIAERLGFAELRSFQRAFRRWTGVTPSQYRGAQ